MHASDHPTTGLYLRGLLAAGARPFIPPSGVYRLLGQPPPQGGAVRFPPPLPPVGFVYEDLARFGRPPGIEGASDSVPSREQKYEGAAEAPRPAPPPASVPAPVPPPAPPSAGGVPPLPMPVPSPPELAAPRETGSGQRAPSLKAERPIPPSVEASAVVPRLPEGTVVPVPSVVEKPGEAGGGEPPTERASVQEDAASAIRVVEQRTGLAIPGLTQRRSIFAALAGTLPHEGGRPSTSSAASESASAPPASEPEAAEGPTAVPAFQPPEGSRAAARPVRPSPAEEGAAFRARTRVVEEVEHVRRAVAAQAERVTPEAVREVARTAAQEAVREEQPSGRSEGRPDRRDAPTPAPVVVVQRVEGAARRVPRAFWSSSALRSTHLRMLR